MNMRLYDSSAQISSPHFSSFFLSGRLPLSRSLGYLFWVVIPVLDKECQHDNHFMCIFYSLFLDNFSLYYPLGQRGELESKLEHLTAQIRCFSLTDLLILTPESFRSSNESRGLTMTRSSTAANHSGRVLLYFFIRIQLNSSGSNLNVTLYVKNRLHPSIM